MKRLRGQPVTSANDVRPYAVDEIAMRMENGHELRINDVLTHINSESFISRHLPLMQTAGMASLGDRLRSRMSQLGIKPAELARLSDVTPQRLNNYLNRGSKPDDDTLERLATALRTSPESLLGSSGTMRSIWLRLLELEGVPGDRAEVLVDVAEEAQRLSRAMRHEADEPLRSRLAAQAVWQQRRSPTPN